MVNFRWFLLLAIIILKEILLNFCVMLKQDENGDIDDFVSFIRMNYDSLPICYGLLTPYKPQLIKNRISEKKNIKFS